MILRKFKESFLVLNNRNIIIFTIIFTKLLATVFTLLIVDKFTPLIDAKMYQDGMFRSEHITLRTYIVQQIANFISFFIHPLASHYLFSLFSALGLIWFVRAYNPKWYILFILLFPTSMIWTSIISKESIYYLFFSILLILWIKIIHNEFKVKHLFALIISILVCMIFRPHYLVCIVWIYWVAIILNNIKNYKLILFGTYFLILGMVLFIVFFGNYIDSFFGTNLFDLKFRAFSSISYDARSSRFIEFGFTRDFLEQLKIFGQKETFLQIDSKMNPLFFTGFIYGIIGPLYEEVINRFEFIPFFIEGVIIMSFPIIIFIRMLIIQKNIFNNINFLNYVYGLFPAIILVMIVHAFFGLFNPGTAVRWRINFELIFYFAPFLLYFKNLEIKNEKNNTFPS